MLQWELHAVTPHAALEQLAVITNHTDDLSKTFLEHAEFFIDMSYYVVRLPPPNNPRPFVSHLTALHPAPRSIKF